MSKATATYTLRDSEMLMCSKCLLHYGVGNEMEVTADPEGWVEILCANCVVIRDNEREAGQEGPCIHCGAYEGDHDGGCIVWLVEGGVA